MSKELDRFFAGTRSEPTEKTEPSFEELLAMFESEKGIFIKQAVIAAVRKGISYRNFQVGSVLVAWSPRDGELVSYDSGNFKPKSGKEEGEQKRCAERMVLDGAIHDGCTTAVAFVIASKEVQPDLEHGIASPTLHPCAECRKMFAENNMVKPQTKIITLRFELGEGKDFNEWGFKIVDGGMEESTVGSLARLHSRE